MYLEVLKLGGHWGRRERERREWRGRVGDSAQEDEGELVEEIRDEEGADNSPLRRLDHNPDLLQNSISTSLIVETTCRHLPINPLDRTFLLLLRLNQNDGLDVSRKRNLIHRHTKMALEIEPMESRKIPGRFSKSWPTQSVTSEGESNEVEAVQRDGFDSVPVGTGRHPEPVAVLKAGKAFVGQQDERKGVTELDGGDRSRPELIVVVGGKTFERNDEVWEEEEVLGCRSIEEELL